MLVFGPIILIGFIDITQNKESLRKNFPFLAHFHFLIEQKIGPRIRQYLSESSQTPFSRDEQLSVNVRAEGKVDSFLGNAPPVNPSSPVVTKKYIFSGRQSTIIL